VTGAGAVAPREVRSLREIAGSPLPSNAAAGRFPQRHADLEVTDPRRSEAWLDLTIFLNAIL
jgi:hypothetical protein